MHTNGKSNVVSILLFLSEKKNDFFGIVIIIDKTAYRMGKFSNGVLVAIIPSYTNAYILIYVHIHTVFSGGSVDKPISVNFKRRRKIKQSKIEIVQPQGVGPTLFFSPKKHNNNNSTCKNNVFESKCC